MLFRREQHEFDDPNPLLLNTKRGTSSLRMSTFSALIFFSQLNYAEHCKQLGDFQFTVVEHSLVKEIDENGKLIKSSGEDSYAYEYEQTDPWYGYFTFTL